VSRSRQLDAFDLAGPEAQTLALEVARAVARQRRLPSECIEDLRQQALKAFIDAATTWSPDGGLGRRAWARLQAQNQLLNIAKRERWHRKHRKPIDVLDPLPEGADSDDAPLPDVVDPRTADRDVGDAVADADELTQLREAVRRLPRNHRRVVTLLYGLDPGGFARTQQDVGERLGLRQQEVAQLHGAALRLLRSIRPA
jgi:RNA polymerase sigma factor (sigma-70 family)